MNRAVVLVAVAAATALASCARNETQRVNRQLRWDDRPARVTCFSYGEVMIDTVSLGAVERDDDGLVSFIDSRSGRMVKTEGECIIEHLEAASKARPELVRAIEQDRAPQPAAPPAAPEKAATP